MKNLWVIKRKNDLLFAELLIGALGSISFFQDARKDIIDESYNDRNFKYGMLVSVVDKDTQKEELNFLEHSGDDLYCLFLVRERVSNQLLRYVMKKTANVAIASTAISKPALSDLIIELLEGNKRWVISEDIQNRILEEAFDGIDTVNLDISLSTVEEKIIALAMEGDSIKKTAEKMGLSTNTIAAYRSQLLRKSGCRSMGHLLAQYRSR